MIQTGIYTSLRVGYSQYKSSSLFRICLFTLLNNVNSSPSA